MNIYEAKEGGIKVYDMIKDVIPKMANKEKGVLKVFLLAGNKYAEQGYNIDNDNTMIDFGKYVDATWVAKEMEAVFEEGFGFWDAMLCVTDNYGKQLDMTIEQVLSKALGLEIPTMQYVNHCVAGVLEREKWITEKLIDEYIKGLPENEKRELSKQIIDSLRKKGVDLKTATQAGSALLVGGLSAARAIMGFDFHILVAQVSNLVVKLLFQRGLSLAANAALQRFVGMFFGPIGWAITGISLIGLVSSMANPRQYEKFIPAIFLIGLTRLSIE